ncbi:helix-turn-helix transcriptional regulator [Chryseobacterium sp. RP-3-3]|uniref:Helix-turn-helix transcriptional regulator n=1 Tax=Chryseobacterium antibioticum TaxID=2728847 RepID=A0A7Y0FTT4_9FLAO|nr:helix-turn-helix transcriptional regulator [Chryseobacterium antibioticum]NML72016.1 helix-turn-helix transcriptional regulator [Chryseobacterium antibioticum]
MAKLNELDKELRTKIILRVRELREEYEDNQSKFAGELGLDKQLLNNWESLSNNRGISIYSINKICKGLDISLKDFFDSTIFSE